MNALAAPAIVSSMREVTARAETLCRLSIRIDVLAMLALDSGAGHLDAALRPDAPRGGSARVAALMWADLGARGATLNRHALRPSEPHALRHAPEVIGALADALAWTGEHVDQLQVDATAGRTVDGGTARARQLAFALDGIKNTVANLADLMDRQLALLVGAFEGIGPQVLPLAVSAWSTQARKLAAPPSVWSEAGAGTIAARDCLRVIELGEQVAAALLVALRHACAIRHPGGLPRQLGAGLRDCYARVAELVPFATSDRRLDADLERLLRVIRHDDAILLCGDMERIE